MQDPIIYLYLWSVLSTLKTILEAILFFSFVGFLIASLLLLGSFDIKETPYGKYFLKAFKVLAAIAILYIAIPSKGVLAVMFSIKPLTELVDTNTSKKLIKTLDNYTDILYINSERSKRKLLDGK
jgi:hypothetical protein